MCGYAHLRQYMRAVPPSTCVFQWTTENDFDTGWSFSYIFARLKIYRVFSCTFVYAIQTLVSCICQRRSIAIDGFFYLLILFIFMTSVYESGHEHRSDTNDLRKVKDNEWRTFKCYSIHHDLSLQSSLIQYRSVIIDPLRF